MAAEYDLKPRYEKIPATALQNAPTDALIGIDQSQSDNLREYFSVTSLGELPSMDCYTAALDVFYYVEKNSEFLDTKVGELVEKGEVCLSLRSDAYDYQLKEILKRPVHYLTGVSAGQDSALYDAFRISVIGQLIKNEIFLETRMIKWIADGNGEVIPSDENREGVAKLAATILGFAKSLPQDNRSELYKDLEKSIISRAHFLYHRDLQLAEISAKINALAGSLGNHQDGKEQEGNSAANRLASTRNVGATRGRNLPELPGKNSQERTINRGTSQRGLPDKEGNKLGGPVRPGSGELPAERTSHAGGPVRPEPRPRVERPKRAPRPDRVARSKTVELPAVEDMINPAVEPPFIKGWKRIALLICGMIVSLLVVGGGIYQSVYVTPPTEVLPISVPVKSYFVKEGDSLWRISFLFFRDGFQWPAIYDENRNLIKNPNLIFPNQKLLIPTNESSESDDSNSNANQ